MLSDILRWGGKRSGQPDAPRDARVARGGEPIVPSKALPKFLSAISNRPEAPVLIDFGPVIGSNVAFFGEHLGCKLFIEDLLGHFLPGKTQVTDRGHQAQPDRASGGKEERTFIAIVGIFLKRLNFKPTCV